MYTRKNYSFVTMLRWTRREILLFTVISVIPVVLYQTFEQRWLHLPWLPIALVGTAVAFIIGFQNSATYDRLWEARKIWGGIVNSSRAWGMMVNDYISNHFTEDKQSEEALYKIRETLVRRHIAWMTALRHALRQPRPWEHFREHPTNREWSRVIGVREHEKTLEEDISCYLPTGDCSRVLCRTNTPAQLLSLQSRALGELRGRDLIDDFRHMEMQSILNELVALQGKSERIKNFPYPRQYATLNTIFVWIFILLLPFGVMLEFGEIGERVVDEFPQIGRFFVWFSIPFSVVVMWIFHTMERIGRVSESPFEGTPNDVPITTIARGIEIDLREMLGEDSANIPSPIEPQMGSIT